MSFREKFSKEIDGFQRYGTYSYEFDSVGNVIFNSSSNDFSQVYLDFPLPNFVYDNTKIISFYDPTFVEFVPPEATGSLTTEDIEQMQNDLEEAQQQNEQLAQRVDELIAINQSTPSLAEKSASKTVILELRKMLGQGRVESDFSADFPYTPILKPNNITSGSSSSPA